MFLLVIRLLKEGFFRYFPKKVQVANINQLIAYGKKDPYRYGIVKVYQKYLVTFTVGSSWSCRIKSFYATECIGIRNGLRVFSVVHHSFIETETGTGDIEILCLALERVKKLSTELGIKVDLWDKYAPLGDKLTFLRNRHA